MNELKDPICEKCNITFKKMIYMDIHMKRVHLESEYMRIDRLKQYVELVEAVIKQEKTENKVKSDQAVVPTECSECGIVFKTCIELKSHMNSEHYTKVDNKKQAVGDEKVILTLTADLTDALTNIKIPEEEVLTINEAEKESQENLLKFANTKFETPQKIVNHRGLKRSLEPSESQVIKEQNNEEYMKESFPLKDDNDKDDETIELQGVTFKGKSRKYVLAYNRLREKFTQGSEFKIKEVNLKVKETPKGKPMKLELSTEGGEKELAQIQMYNPAKKGATILLTRSKGDSFEAVQIIADNFIEVFLKALLKGLVKGDEEMKDYERQGKILEKDIFDCDKCDRKFPTNHGLAIHTAWHTKRAKTDISDLPVKHTVEPKQVIVPKVLQQSKCENCDQIFTEDHKYQTIQRLLTHKKICTSKITIATHYRTKTECDECGYMAKN